MEHTTSQQPVTQNNANITVNYTSEDCYAEVRELSEEGALLIIGAPGSGKTEKLCWLMASHCHQGHWVWLINPFAPPWRYKGLRVFGRDLNYQEAASGLREFVEEANKRIHSRDTDPNYNPFHELHIHLAIDEISNYSNRIRAHDKTIMQEFWEICTQSLKRVNMSVSVVSHRDTQDLMSGEKNQRDKSKARDFFPKGMTPFGEKSRASAIKHDLVRLYCKWMADPMVKGKRQCAGWAEKVTMSADDQEIVTKIDIPDWMIAPPDYNYETSALRIVRTLEQLSEV